jgi:hypothetical protein
MRIGHKVERFVLLKAGKEAAVKGLLRQEGAAEVERPGHDIDIDRGGKLVQEALEVVKDV